MRSQEGIDIPSVVLNGRVLASIGAGVARYAVEIQRRLGLVALVPPVSLRRGSLGHFWEQVILPRRVGRRLLFSPANTGPANITRQVITIHDVATLDHPEWFSRRFAGWYSYILRRLAMRVERVIVPSNFTRSRLLKNIPSVENKIKVVYHGIDHAEFRCTADGTGYEVDRRAEEVRILVVGTLEPRKNVQVVLQAWPKVRKRLGRSATLFVVGGLGPGRVFRRIGLDGVTEGVRFLGRVSDRDLVRLYRTAAVFVYPSRYEGFGFPLLEALAHGVPTVASDIPVVREVAGEAVICVDPDSSDEFAEATSRLVEDRDLREVLVRRGLERVAKYRWDVCAQQTLEILREVV